MKSAFALAWKELAPVCANFFKLWGQIIKRFWVPTILALWIISTLAFTPVSVVPWFKWPLCYFLMLSCCSLIGVVSAGAISALLMVPAWCEAILRLVSRDDTEEERGNTIRLMGEVCIYVAAVTAWIVGGYTAVWAMAIGTLLGFLFGVIISIVSIVNEAKDSNVAVRDIVGEFKWDILLVVLGYASLGLLPAVLGVFAITMLASLSSDNMIVPFIWLIGFSGGFSIITVVLFIKNRLLPAVRAKK